MIDSVSANFDTNDNFFNNLPKNEKIGYRLIGKMMEDKVKNGKYKLDILYSDESIEGEVFSLLEDSNFYYHLISLGYESYYTPNKGQFTIYWGDPDYGF